MNRWLLIRRLRWPAFVILFGITALLNQWDVLSFGRSWPLYLILAGILLLAEHTAMTGAVPPQFPASASLVSYEPRPSDPGSSDPRPSEPGSSSAPPQQSPFSGDSVAGEQSAPGNRRE